MSDQPAIAEAEDYGPNAAADLSPVAAQPDRAGVAAGRAASRYVYAIGRIEPRFPSLGIEKEFAQATGRAETTGLTDREAVHAVLAEPTNRYLARALCWVLTIEGQDTYLLASDDAEGTGMLIDAVRPDPRPGDIDVVIGTLGPLAPAEACNGLIVPIVAFRQIYSFDTDALLSAIPRPDALPADRFQAAAQELFARIGQLADNAGATDEHRALNYLAVRSPAIYAHTAQKYAADAALTSVEVLPSRLSGIRTLLNVIFTYTDRNTGVTDKAAVKVDVTEQFPFQASPLTPYYDR
jgi:PatG Domain